MKWLEIRTRQKEIKVLYKQMFISFYKVIAISNNYNIDDFLVKRESDIRTWSAKWFYTDCHKILKHSDREIVAFAIERFFKVETKRELDPIVLFDLVEFIIDNNSILNPITINFFFDPVHREIW